MIVSKVICDDTYSNKSSAIVGQGMFQLKEINRMEGETCSYLKWQLNVNCLQLEEFTKDVQTLREQPHTYHQGLFIGCRCL